MALRISVSKLANRDTLMSRLPRFNLDLRINNTKIEFLYTPITETILKIMKTKKDPLEVANKQFSEFDKKTPKKSKAVKRKTK